MFLLLVTAHVMFATNGTQNPQDCITQATTQLSDSANPTVRALTELIAVPYCSAIGKPQDGLPKSLGTDYEQLKFSDSFGGNNPKTFLDATVSEALQNQAKLDLLSALQNRPDKQTSANASSAGTTSLIEKAGGSELIALALDAGALTKTVSGTTATLSGNLDGISSFLVDQDPLAYLSGRQSSWKKLAGQVNLSASFELNQQSSDATTDTQPATSTAPPAGTSVNIPSSVGRLSSVTAKFAFLNPFDPHSTKFRKRWAAAVADSVDSLGKGINDLESAIQPIQVSLSKDSKFESDWNNEQAPLIAALKRSVSEKTPNAFAEEYSKYYSRELGEARKADPDFDTQVLKMLQAEQAVLNVTQGTLSEARGTLGSLQYAYNRPAKQPETHDITFIYGYSPGGENSQWSAATGNVPILTLNANMSIYGGTIPSTAKYGRLHYGQVSGQFDRPLSTTGPMNSTIITLAGYWQYQPDPSVLNLSPGDVAPGTTIDAPTQVLVGTAGSLFVTQAKISMKTKTGLTIPLGVKWSNKTDLLSGTKVGAQVGISYDLSGLASLFGGGH